MNHLDPDMDDLPDGNVVSGGSANPQTGMSAEPESGGLDSQRQIGRFRIDYMLGRGGMGEVYKAFDTENDRSVAIKILDTRGYEDADTLRRFERESQAALVLDHQNIARFFGTERDANDQPIIVMEYIAGRGLDSLLDDNPDMLFSTRIDFVIQAARGLENAYRRSIIHRDIKPGNLLIDETGTVKIIDFGLAKSMWDNTNLTGSGMVVGTPRYISPEQGMGRNVDHRSDIYSLGATLYEVMTGKTPFDGDTPLAIMMKHINAPLTPPYLVNPKVPGDVSEIIMKMLAKEPGQRYQDYEPLIRDLESAKITRLAKERRNHGDISGMNTVMLAENTAGATDEYIAASNYLTEGLINIDNIPTADSSTSPAKIVFLSLAGIAVLFFVGLFLMKPTDGATGSSTLGQKLAGLFAKAKQAPALTSATQLADQDRDFIRTTQSRMEAVISKLLSMRPENGRKSMPTITELRRDEVFTPEETRDAWGNNFYITDSAGVGTLVAPGRDGVDNTSDDFRMSLDGNAQTIPKPIEVDQAKATKSAN